MYNKHNDTGKRVEIKAVFNHGGKEVFSMEKNNIVRRALRRPALCPVCGKMFTGDALVIPIIRGKLAYIHDGCAGKVLTGEAFQPFNDNGGSIHTFGVVVHTTATDKDERTVWAVYMRSAGFDTRTVASNIRAEGFVPAQSISKVLRTLFKTCKSVDINTHNFTNLEEALEYVKSTTKGNSHK